MNMKESRAVSAITSSLGGRSIGHSVVVLLGVLLMVHHSLTIL